MNWDIKSNNQITLVQANIAVPVGLEQPTQSFNHALANSVTYAVYLIDNNGSEVRVTLQASPDNFVIEEEIVVLPDSSLNDSEKFLPAANGIVLIHCLAPSLQYSRIVVVPQTATVTYCVIAISGQLKHIDP